jgi:hypothetical protein
MKSGRPMARQAPMEDTEALRVPGRGKKGRAPTRRGCLFFISSYLCGILSPRVDSAWFSSLA